jgi:WD40 repeat protein
MNMNMNQREIVEMNEIMREINAAKENVKETIRYWQNVLDELDRRAYEYGELVNTMKAKEGENKKKRNDVALIHKLNLRGTVFNTSKDTLLKFHNTYFTTLLSSTLFKSDINGEFFIDRNSHCFDRILDYMSTGLLSTEGLNRYDEDCLYGNLQYFMIPHKSTWNYFKVSAIKTLRTRVCLQLRDGRLCGKTDDYSICIYNMERNAVETTMNGHADPIGAIIQLEDGRLCSCSYDTTIKLWNIESGQSDQTIVGHTDRVTSVIQLVDGRLCSGSFDDTIKIWGKDSGVCELSINTYAFHNYLVQLRNGSVCSGNLYGRINIWNTTTGVCEMTLTGHTSSISAIVVIDELTICSSSWDKTTRVWNVSTGVCESTSKGHTDCVIDMALLFDGRMCSVSDDGSAKIWNIETGVCDIVFHVCIYLCDVVQLHDGRLVVTDINRNVYIIG